MRMIRPSRLDEEGRTRRHDRGAGCDGRGRAFRRTAQARAAKPCGPDAPVAGVKSTEDVSADDGDNKAGLTGESTE